MNRQERQKQLAYLYRKHDGKCAMCGDPTVIVIGTKGGPLNPRMAVRFRTGSSYGEPGRRRPRVLACFECAQKRSDQITASVPLDELHDRSGRHTEVFYSVRR
jgi:hypothetical protein